VQGFVGAGAPCASQKATTPEFPVTSAMALLELSCTPGAMLLAVVSPMGVERALAVLTLYEPLTTDIRGVLRL
jgi:hypothetical protein